MNEMWTSFFDFMFHTDWIAWAKGYLGLWIMVLCIGVPVMFINWLLSPPKKKN